MLSVVIPSAVFAVLAALVAWSLGASVWVLAAVYTIAGIVGALSSAFIFMKASETDNTAAPRQNSHITT